MSTTTTTSSPFRHLAGAVLSDQGRKRKNNEDSAGEFPGHGVWCVADGMGGGDDGEVASQAVVKALGDCLDAMPEPETGYYPASAVAAEFDKAISAASAWIYDRAQKNGLKGCGSTVVGVIFDPVKPAEALAFHVGDSRLYRLRGKEIKQITKDHSVAEMMGAKDEKNLNPMFRSMILRAVGIERDVQVEFSPFSVKEGDLVIVCSDGLTRMLPDKRIAEIARECPGDPKETCRRLVYAANEAGGLDNVTVDVVRVGPLPPPLPGCQSHIKGEEGDTEDSATSLTSMQETLTPHPGKTPWHEKLNWKVLSIVLAVLLGVAVTAAVVFAVTSRGKSAPPPPPPVAAIEPAAAPVQEAVLPKVEEPTPQQAVVPEPKPKVQNEEKKKPRKREKATLESLRSGMAGDVVAATGDTGLAETAEDAERKAAQELLRAEREQRERDDAEAAAVEKMRIETAKDLAEIAPSYEFAAFVNEANALLGKNATVSLETLARAMYTHRGHTSLYVAATDFTQEAAKVAARLAKAMDAAKMPRTKARTAGYAALKKDLAAFSHADPAEPETQKKCLELIKAAAASLGEDYGRAE
ncbi:MAG: serine/threonine-protein phosphatase [Kiritimatiellae bacterium]|nr:serine/threonine-protein phosphatase [Kiritimatiellia bacterium]